MIPTPPKSLAELPDIAADIEDHISRKAPTFFEKAFLCVLDEAGVIRTGIPRSQFCVWAWSRFLWKRFGQKWVRPLTRFPRTALSQAEPKPELSPTRQSQVIKQFMQPLE